MNVQFEHASHDFVFLSAFQNYYCFLSFSKEFEFDRVIHKKYVINREKIIRRDDATVSFDYLDSESK